MSTSQTQSASLHRWDDMDGIAYLPGVEVRRILGEHMTMIHVVVEQGAVHELHHHESEQFTYVFEGALKFNIGEDRAEQHIVRPGEVLLVPPNVPHEVEGLERTVEVDVFSPPRVEREHPPQRDTVEDPNVSLVKRYLDHLCALEIDEMLGLWDEHGVIEIPWAPEGITPRLVEGRSEIEAFLRPVLDVIRTYRYVDATFRTISDDGSVVAEYRSESELHDGRSYDQQYCTIFSVRGGRLVRMREYLDPLVVIAAFGPSEQAS